MKLTESMIRGKKVRVDTGMAAAHRSVGIRWNRDQVLGAGNQYEGLISVSDLVTGKRFTLSFTLVEWEDIREQMDKMFAEAPA